MNDKKVFVDINNAHGDEMLIKLRQIIEDGVDPFSLEHMSKYHTKPILKVGKHWFVTENQWPYPNARYQFLFITLDYAETFSDISPEAFAELQSLNEEFCNDYKIEGGALCMRFGDTTVTGATVKHLHAQLIVPEANVVFPIGRKKG